LPACCAKRQNPGDDDGSFVNAGYLRTILNISSYPYADAHYHLETDVADRVDPTGYAFT
jgi:hypothetical protein